MSPKVPTAPAPPVEPLRAAPAGREEADGSQPPLVVAVDMGYGHLRAAEPLARALGTKVTLADGSDLADEEERRIWQRTRRFYELTTRLSQVPWVGAPMRAVVEAFTSIPHLHPHRDLSAPTVGARQLDKLVKSGLGRGLCERLRASGRPLLTTFYAPAIAADRNGLGNVFMVVTDSDINRIWAPFDGRASRIRFLVPSRRASRRLQAYGIAPSQIEVTGFPLPVELLGGPDLPVLRKNLAARLVRLDSHRAFRDEHGDAIAHLLGPLPEEEERRPPHLVFTVGGAGAQAGLARKFLPGVRDNLEAGRLRVTLVAGVRPEVAAAFEEAIALAGLSGAVGHGLEILKAESHADYFPRFNALLAGADILWTKPSEMTFFGALGLPLVCSWPVGVHENYNRRWAIEAGAGLKQRDPRWAGHWIDEWLADGTLAAAAWSGYTRLPKRGLYRILEAVGAGAAARPDVAQAG